MLVFVIPLKYVLTIFFRIFISCFHIHSIKKEPMSYNEEVIIIPSSKGRKKQRLHKTTKKEPEKEVKDKEICISDRK